MHVVSESHKTALASRLSCKLWTETHAECHRLSGPIRAMLRKTQQKHVMMEVYCAGRCSVETSHCTWVPSYSRAGQRSKTLVSTKVMKGRGLLIGDKPRARSLSFRNTCLPFSPPRHTRLCRLAFFPLRRACKLEPYWFLLGGKSHFHYYRPSVPVRRPPPESTDEWRKLSRSLPGQRQPRNKEADIIDLLRARSLLTRRQFLSLLSSSDCSRPY